MKNLKKYVVGVFGAAAIFSAASAHSEEAGVTDTKIVIGQSAAFSGPASQLGQDMNLGARTYFQMLNERGGIHGRKIELLTRDDGYEPDRAAQNTQEFIEKDKVFALFGYVGTPTSNAALPIFTAAKVPFIGAYTGAQSLREPFNRYVFNVRASYFDETESIIAQLMASGMKNIAVLYQNDAYGKAGLEGVTRAMARRNAKIAGSATVERNSTDVSAAVASLKAVQPQAIVQITAYASSAAFIREMKKSGYTGQFINVSFVGSKALADLLGKDSTGVVVSHVVPFPWAGSAALQLEYAQAMKKSGVPDRGFGSMEGFIAAKVFAEAVTRAGKNLTREKLVDAFESMQKVDLGGFSIAFSKTSHNGSQFVEMTMIGQGGRFVK